MWLSIVDQTQIDLIASFFIASLGSPDLGVHIKGCYGDLMLVYFYSQRQFSDRDDPFTSPRLECWYVFRGGYPREPPTA